MGCVPPQTRQKPTARASKAVSKSSKRLSNKSRSSTTSIQNSNQKQPNQQLNDSTKHRREIKSPSISSSPKFKKTGSEPVEARMYSSKGGNTPGKLVEKHSIRVLPPQKTQRQIQNGQLSRIASVHSLDLNSNIKIAEGSSKRILQQKAEKRSKDKLAQSADREEFVNITFNNNNFATTNSSKVMTKKLKEDILREELKGINEENFRKISVKKMNFDESRIE